MGDVVSHLPTYLQSRVLLEATQLVNGTSFRYVVITQPDLDEAPLYCVGYNPSNDVYFISVSVPPEYREHVLRHEMFRSGIMRNHPGSFRMAFHFELAHVFFQQWRNYAAWRLEALKSLYGWMSTHAQAQYADEDYNNVWRGISLMEEALRE